VGSSSEFYLARQFTDSGHSAKRNSLLLKQQKLGCEGRNRSLFNPANQKKSGYKLYFAVTNFIFPTQI
jgi:hypothetical protein